MIYKRGWQKTLSIYELDLMLEKEGVEQHWKVAKLLVGEYDERWHPYTVVDNSWSPDCDVKIWQRINQLWFVPIFILTIPIQWLFTGSHGFSNSSKIGKFLSKLTGLQ
ncbi:TPA: hypothetical protein ACQ431_002977 [Citrobacter murliniae]